MNDSSTTSASRRSFLQFVGGATLTGGLAALGWRMANSRCRTRTLLRHRRWPREPAPDQRRRPRFSTLKPTRIDSLPWIEHCLESVAGVPTVVVDNGSSDGTVAFDHFTYTIRDGDGNGNSTLIERDASGQATAMVGPFGQQTLLVHDADGYLTAVVNPAGETVQFGYENGLLISRSASPVVCMTPTPGWSASVPGTMMPHWAVS